MSSNRTLNGLIWSGIERFATQGVQFITSIVIARLVLPYDYGLIAMVMIFIALGQAFVDSGFSNALIHKPDRNQIDYSTVFIFNAVMAVAFYALLFLIANPIAKFYNTSELVPIIKVISLGIIFSGLSVVQRAILTIDINFKLQAKTSFISAIFSGIFGIILAYLGYGVWALVCQSLANSFSNTFLLWIVTKWRPNLVFSYSSFKSLFAFGSSLLVTGIVQTIYVNLYSILIGKEYHATDLGYFNRASTMASFIPLSLSDVMYRVIYPVQCEIQNEQDRLSALFHLYLDVSAYVVYPICIIIASLSQPLINTILGTQWADASTLLSILVIGYMLRPTICINETILTVVGRTKKFLKLDIIRKIIGLAILIVSLKFGIFIMSLGLTVCYIIDLSLGIYFAKRVVKTSFIKQAKILIPIILSAAISGGCAYTCQSLTNCNWLNLVLGIISGVAIYLLISYITKSKELTLIKNIIRDQMTK